MKVELAQKVVGIHDRGFPTENKRVFAESGDRVHVLFDNTTEDEFGNKIGHYVCNRGDQTFVVFSSQISQRIKENDYEDAEESLVVPRKLVIDDLLYTERTEDEEHDPIEQL